MSTPTLPAPLTVLVPLPAEVPWAVQARVEAMAAEAKGWPDWRTAHWSVEYAPGLGTDVLGLQVQVTVRPVAS